MVWRDGEAPGQGVAGGSAASASSTGSSAKLTVLLVVMTFVAVAIALVALRPEAQPEDLAAASVDPVPAPVIAPQPQPQSVVAAQPVQAAPEPPVPQPATAVVVEQEVTRADASLLELRQAVQSEEASHILRQLASGNGARANDLPLLARRVLNTYGYPVRDGDRLHALLVSSLANQKSDAYIDALLNTAVARGEFTPPFALVRPSGRMDTSALLRAMVRAARG